MIMTHPQKTCRVRYPLNILFLIMLSGSLCQGQILKGRITNEAGDPVQYSTVYIQELRQGTTSNTKGDYEIHLPAGKYTVIYQSLGYAQVFADITLSDQTITKNVVLPLQYYQIPEVRITASGEDPAYIIMRKVIGLAPYYLNNISYYKADVYLKGNLVINNIPRIIAKRMKVETNDPNTPGKQKETQIKEGDSYMMESFNEMEFTAPDKYKQRVISQNSTFPEEGNEISPMDFIEASFYQPLIADMAISPLSPSAFSHYNFKYLGASPQGNFTIDKIQVTPKRKSQQLFEGTIYIIEDLWCLHSVDLTNENLVGKVRVQQLFIPVQDEIWMPVSHKFEINISVMGFKADAGYGSSVKYNEVRPNLALEKPKSISTDYTGKTTATVTPDTAVSKTKKQINKILEKDELTNRDMIKLSRLIEKESEKSLPDSARNNLEIRDNTEHIIEKDAGKKDSAYWTEIRPIPLTDVEKRSLRVSDSIKTASKLVEMKQDSSAVKDSTKTDKKFLNTVRHIGTGHTWYMKKGVSFSFGGLIDLNNLSFNTVDGFIYGFDFRFSKTWENKNSFNIFPDLKWAFSREAFMWRVNANYNINGLKHKQIFLRTGSVSKDISGQGINPFLNTAYTLVLRENYMKLYDSRYVILGFRMEVTNGLEIEFSPGFEDRQTLQNNTDFSFFNQDEEYTPNIPVNPYLDSLSNPYHAIRDQKHLDFVTKVTFVPRRKYRIENGNKIYMGSDWPTFSLTWEHGINEFAEPDDSYRHYDMFRLDVDQSIDIGALSRFRWRVSAAGIPDNSYLPFYDFINLNAQPLALQINDYADAYMIPSFYTLNVPGFAGEVHLKYTTPYLLLKFLPGLSNTLMRENVSLSYLGSFSNVPNYTEVGYALSEIFLLAEIGIYVGFDDLKYRSVGGKLKFRFN